MHPLPLPPPPCRPQTQVAFPESICLSPEPFGDSLVHPFSFSEFIPSLVHSFIF